MTPPEPTSPVVRDRLGGGVTAAVGFFLAAFGAFASGWPGGGMQLGLGLLAIGTAFVVGGFCLIAAESICRVVRETASNHGAHAFARVNADGR